MEFIDIICLNRYNGWYSYPGRLDLIKDSIIAEISKWFHNFNKPVIITEYGADSYFGQHSVCIQFYILLVSVLLKLKDSLFKNSGFLNNFLMMKSVSFL